MIRMRMPTHGSAELYRTGVDRCLADDEEYPCVADHDGKAGHDERHEEKKCLW